MSEAGRMPYISVVVVFRNAESTIMRTLQSLASQTLDNVEYIFVDDGSSDHSAGVLHDFLASRQDFAAKCRIISGGSNHGVAWGTTVGYAAATGEYVIRCDADDYLEPSALETLWQASDGGRFDAVFAPYFCHYKEDISIVDFPRRTGNLNDMPIDTLHFALWNKALRRQILIDNEIAAFSGADCWEDLGIVARFLTTNPTIAYVDRPLYNYVVAEGNSLSTGNQSRQLEDRLTIAALIETWFGEHGYQDTYREFLNHVKFFAKVKMLRGRNKDFGRWKKTFPEVNREIIRLRHLNWRWRLLFAAVAALPACRRK